MTAKESPPARHGIHRLDESTVRQIAAGEVVERPASVVKELVENALDAGATQIRISLERGGLDLIEVADDGQGISRSDFPLLFERHATSKLQSPEQLLTVGTLGFRGEALASIAAVAHVGVASRPEGASTAYSMDVGPGRSYEEPRPVARAPGTTLAVRDLFHNVPARRKFLKSVPAETQRITEIVEHLYLATTSVSFQLTSDGGEVLRFPPAKSLTEAATNAFGVEFAERCFTFSGSGGPGTWVDGVVSHPSLTRGNSGRLLFAVNGRPIVSRPLVEALRSAFLDIIPKGRYPLGLVHLQIEGEGVDVNVHPSKREVRFRWEEELRSSLRSLVVSNLQEAGRSSLPPPSPPASVVLPLSPPPPPPGVQQTLSAPGGSGIATEVRPTVRGTSVQPKLILLGQVGALYIVGERDDGQGLLVLIDAHAASERVIYERLVTETAPAHQDLLVPTDIDLTPRQATVFARARDDLREMGFQVEHFGGSRYRVSAIPSFFWHRVEPSRISQVLDELGEADARKVRSELRERVAKTLACHMAIRAGDALTLEEMERLVKELYGARDTFTCPHGRPIMISLRRDELDKWFHRPTVRNSP